ncbi:hypothetical protein [Eggerthella sp. YY7918]|uniref:hypothetical protein n=1 Tax=Eggerthella sp. (strain YY7918) TaxID=502558 RepID=UPI000217148F|nr:hypothetical protein [Eggerthella sp. YY7918]BAK45421.1 molybdopterin-guanine dinucleotide biosynthesis protein A [Eggerthella sp. YY7918]
MEEEKLHFVMDDTKLDLDPADAPYVPPEIEAKLEENSKKMWADYAAERKRKAIAATA